MCIRDRVYHAELHNRRRPQRMGFLGAAVGLAGLMVTPVFGQETRDVQIIGGAWKTAPATTDAGGQRGRPWACARCRRAEPTWADAPGCRRRRPHWRPWTAAPKEVHR